MMVSVSSEKYEDSEYPVIRMLLSAPSIIDRTTAIVGFALILNDGGVVTTSETLSVLSIFRADWIVLAISSQSVDDKPGYCLRKMSAAMSVPLAASALMVFRSISLLTSPPDRAHSPTLGNTKSPHVPKEEPQVPDQACGSRSRMQFLKPYSTNGRWHR